MSDDVTELFRVIGDAMKARDLRIEQLERELARCESERDCARKGSDYLQEAFNQVDAQLAAEKALADALYHDASSVYGIQPETGAAYRKARGL